MRKNLVFLRNGKRVEVDQFDPNETLLDYLRLRERKTGTKEGCNEGDCGACTVSLGRLRGGKLCYEPVNSCILLLGQVDGCDVITVDDLAKGDKLHPVQQSMVDLHGSQCGFCTPGFVMTLFTMHHSGERVTRQSINDWIAGNLCRCTGYRPIVDAALDSVGSKPKDGLIKRWDNTEKALQKMAVTDDLVARQGDRMFAAPGSLEHLAELCKRNPQATIVSGSTDVGLWITKQLRDLPQIIWTGKAKGFEKISETARQIKISAGATYKDAFGSLARLDPDIGEVMRRLGSRHVRASGTIGGNIANGSPIGDMPPLLIALDAKLELRLGEKARHMAIEDFFIDYGKQDRKPGELVASVTVPKPGKNEHFRAFKISKRFDQDISAVLFACKLSIKNGRITAARIACGGMAATPKRAENTEAALVNAMLDDPFSWEAAVEGFAKDYSPLTDMRASATYRLKIVQNLLRKSLTEIGEEVRGDKSSTTRVIGFREAAE